jgi:NAD(P)H-hydrate epimerase
MDVATTVSTDYEGPLPLLTRAQMARVDEIVIGEFKISLLQMMENAGRSLAELAVELFDPGSVTVLFGPGHNGGGGLAAARHLRSRGVEVTVVGARLDRLSSETAHQLDTVRAMGLRVTTIPVEADVVIDALVGYSLDGAPRGETAKLIDWTNQQREPRLSLDLPSGLDPTTGRFGDRCVRATATMTLGMPKIGLRRGAEVVGELYLADISIPLAVYERMGLTFPLVFEQSPIVHLKNRTSLEDASCDEGLGDLRVDQIPVATSSSTATPPRIAR